MACHAQLIRALMFGAVLHCVPAGLHAQQAQQSQADAKVSPNNRSYVDWSSAELIAKIPELEGLVPVASKEEGQKALPVILGRVGENVEQFLNKVPNVISREEITMESLYSNY
jgi:hypothetical protein